MLDVVVRVGDDGGLEGRRRQVVQALEAAPLQQFGEAALERHLHARVRAERHEHAARARVHQGDAHHRIHPAQRRILHQHRETLALQLLDAGDDAGIFRQHFRRHVGQRDLALDDLALHRALENLRQALHLRLGQRVAGAHAVAEEEVVGEVGREIHHRAVGLAHIGQRADAALGVARVGVVQMRGAQLALGVVDRPAMFVEQPGRQRILAAGLEPALVRVMHEGRVGDVLAPELVVVEVVEIEPLDVFAQGRRQRALLACALAIGETHRRMRIADVQRPHVRHQIAPRRDLDLDAQVRQHLRHVGDRLLQRQILAEDVGVGVRIRIQRQQGLGIGVQVLHLLDHELRPGLHHLLHGAALDRAQDALAVLVGDVGRQLDLDLEDLLVAVLRIDDVVLRQADVVGGDVARFAVQLHEVGRAQRRRRQEVIERTGRRAVALVADGLIGDDREVVELGFETKLVEEVDLDFHGGG